MNTPPAVEIKKSAILSEILPYSSMSCSDVAAERERTRAILKKMSEKRAEQPALTPFDEKILAKSLDVYDPYVDAGMQRKQTGEVVIRPAHTISSIVPDRFHDASGRSLWVKSALGTRYPLSISDELILKLESVRDCDFRIRFEDGFTDPSQPDLVGQATSERFAAMQEGYFSRDKNGLPLLFSTARSSAALPLDVEHIVGVEFANRTHGGELWRHPSYRPDDGYFTSLDQNDFLIRSRLTGSGLQSTNYYDIKLYDQGRLIFEERDFSPTILCGLNPRRDHLLPDEAMPELIAMLALKPGQEPEEGYFEKYSPKQLQWCQTERVDELAEIGYRLEEVGLAHKSVGPRI